MKNHSPSVRKQRGKKSVKMWMRIHRMLAELFCKIYVRAFAEHVKIHQLLSALFRIEPTNMQSDFFLGCIAHV